MRNDFDKFEKSNLFGQPPPPQQIFKASTIFIICTCVKKVHRFFYG